MSSFTRALIIKKLAERDLFEVVESFEYHVGKKNSGEIIVIPAGFVTDLASIPYIVRGLIPRVGRHCQAAVVHDYTYQKNTFTRKKCDEIFLESMEVLEVPRWKRRLMYRAVRIFGGFCWKDVDVEKT